MRSLEQALSDHELIVLRAIGEWWELDLTGLDKPACVQAVAQALMRLDMPQEAGFLPPEEGAAFSELVAANGRIPVATFSRTHGEVRLMGPGRMEREEPWLAPESVTEALWYRGFVYRGFDETAEGLIEFYYIPNELLAPFSQDNQAKVVKETATSFLDPAEAPTKVKTAVTNAVDDLTTILALAQSVSLRVGDIDYLRPYLLDPTPDRCSLLLTLGQEMGMLRESGEGELRPARSAVKWLKQSREAQLHALADAWSNSNWNDLCHTPGLVCEGERWHNDPILARTALLDAFPSIEHWFRLGNLVAHIKENDPDFQRPDGNYETWYIRDEASNTYITGFENWELVEGRLLQFLVRGPLFWLGLVELGDDSQPDAVLFRPALRALAWLANEPPSQEEVRVPLVVQADGSLLVPYNAGRYERFQAARITEAEPVEPQKPFRYRLTPHSLAQARDQGIAPDRLLQFLERSSGRPVPAGVRRAITRWSERGVEGRIETTVVLRVRDAAILETLRNNPKTRPFMGESLGELAATVRADEWRKLVEAAAQLGLFLDVDMDLE